MTADGPSLEKAYHGLRVLVTGHTGFKGSWLTLWLNSLGANVTGLSLPPNTTPSLFDAAAIGPHLDHHIQDIRDAAAVAKIVREAQPDVVFHLAAQPLVRESYRDPLGTLSTNVMGTANLLEAVRALAKPCVVVVITTDKVYAENGGWSGYRETDRLGGSDLYSSSKACAELVVHSYRKSFFPVSDLQRHGIALASCRAGNVIGGGDWSAERIMTDVVAALQGGQPVALRSPGAIRPWQHVLEPLYGYLLLGSKLREPPPVQATYCDAWNFGPDVSDQTSVQSLVQMAIAEWGHGTWQATGENREMPEAATLRLSSDKARIRLGWHPRWRVREAVSQTISWYRAFYAEAISATAVRELCERQIRTYIQSRANGEDQE